MAKARVSPMSIIDLTSSQGEEDVDVYSRSDTFVSGYVELKQLEHPLASVYSPSDASYKRNCEVDEFGKGSSMLLSNVSLIRTSTPRDLFVSNTLDDSLSEILDSDEPDPEKASDKGNLKCTEAVILSAIPTPVVVIGQVESDASDSRTKPAARKVSSLPSVFRNASSSRSTSMTVSFNETMEVRYFYRSDDEIAIMKQCAMERRRQQETRRRLRRKRKGMRSPSFILQNANMASFFYHGCTDDGILQGMDHTDALHNEYDDSDDFEGDVFHCGTHFQRFPDEQCDAESDDDVPLNIEADEDLKKSAFYNMIGGLSSLLTGSDGMNDVKPIHPQDLSEGDFDSKSRLISANEEDEDVYVPWFISSLCGHGSKIIALTD